MACERLKPGATGVVAGEAAQSGPEAAGAEEVQTASNTKGDPRENTASAEVVGAWAEEE